MSLLMIILIGIGVLLLGAGIGYYLRVLVALGKIKSIEIDIKQILVGAKEEAQKIIDEAKDKAEKKLAELKEEEKKQEQELKETEKRLIKTEKRIELERVSKLTEEEAKEELMRDIEKKYEEDILIRIQKLENSNEEKLDKRAKDILATSIQRLASSTASELMTTIVNIPNNEIKGKVIGKEGRNIRAFERASGVELIVDDTPGSIIISSFDPIRRQIARLALENLILDGRIQPAKIEELVEKAKEEINKI